jgi:hypothetical protein
MAKFSFNLPNGLLFTLEAPAGTTAIEAERVYLEQLAAGTFVGLKSGDTLQSPTTTGVQFSLSRLDRGTAVAGHLRRSSGFVVACIERCANQQRHYSF